MAIDLSQFHQVFYEESFEGLDIMESSLMDLDPSDIDNEVINAIFRSAHSIKGGSATFGFTSIAEFTHVLETLLDQVRSGARDISTDDVDLFLRSVDCMREMLELLQSGEDGKTALSAELEERFTRLLNGESHPQSSAQDNHTATVSQFLDDHPIAPSSPLGARVPGWRIRFAPHHNMLKTGNDPSYILRELGKLGALTCQADWQSLPNICSLDCENVYLSWNLWLEGDVARADIDDVFEWVVDEADIVIEQVTQACLDQAKVLADDADTSVTWMIDFQPNLEMLQTGNDPVKLFQVLADLGQIMVRPVINKMPSLDDLQSEQCYLAWNIELVGSGIDEAAIVDVFEWVIDEASVDIKAVAGLFGKSDAKTQHNADPLTRVSTEVVPEVVAGDTPPDVKQASAKTPANKKATGSGEASSIRVGIDKVDNLINMVGELVITQSMLGQLGEDFDIERLPKLIEGLGQLEQNTRELQESVMRIRMLPISFVFSRFPRMVRDLSKTLDKELELEVIGEHTELDKTVMEKIGDPLVHLVRNAVDHGIEQPADRLEHGKSRAGKVVLKAFHQGGNIVIQIVDDGKGLDPEMLKRKAVEKQVITQADADLLTPEQAFDLIFQPGFSTAAVVSDVSGRGVGMDVVKRNIQALNGAIEVSSELGRGSTFTIRLPLTLAILDGQLVRVTEETYIFPLVSIVESMQCKRELISQVAGGCEVFKVREEYVPIIQLSKVFGVHNGSDAYEDSLVVVVESDGDHVGIVVDELLAQQQVVIKSLEQNYQRVQGISGATILGDGTVALIVDIPGIVRLAGESYRTTQHAAHKFMAQSHEQNPCSIRL